MNICGENILHHWQQEVENIIWERSGNITCTCLEFMKERYKHQIIEMQ